MPALNNRSTDKDINMRVKPFELVHSDCKIF